MKLLLALLSAVFLCSCPSRAVISKPGEEIVDEAGRSYNVYKDGKWQMVRPLPRWREELEGARHSGGRNESAAAS
jgi:hypothetical protein